MRTILLAGIIALFTCCANAQTTPSDGMSPDNARLLCIYDSIRNANELLERTCDHKIVIIQRHSASCTGYTAHLELIQTKACPKPSPYRSLQSPDELQKMPYNNIEDIVPFLMGNTYQQRLGYPIQIGGGR